tara:strand:+ start:555 stop:782 length:228 start_codon:yes stop_codon:yes gene_type:complete
MSRKIIRVYKDYDIDIDDTKLKQWKDSIDKHPENGWTMDDFYYPYVAKEWIKEDKDKMKWRPYKYEIINEENKIK